ncbi:NUDIX hydrolase [Chloroflexota bacterium]
MKVARKVFETEWFSVDEIPYEPGKPYYRISSRDWVEILAVTGENKVILVRQFRPALDIYTLELPSGYVNDGETLEEAAKREFQEETGFVCHRMIVVGDLKAMPSRINNKLWIFYGENASPVNGEIRGEDGIEIVTVTVDEFERMATKGEFTEAAGLAAYLLCQLKGLLPLIMSKGEPSK